MQVFVRTFWKPLLSVKNVQFARTYPWYFIIYPAFHFCSHWYRQILKPFYRFQFARNMPFIHSDTEQRQSWNKSSKLWAFSCHPGNDRALVRINENARFFLRRILYRFQKVVYLINCFIHDDVWIYLIHCNGKWNVKISLNIR